MAKRTRRLVKMRLSLLLSAVALAAAVVLLFLTRSLVSDVGAALLLVGSWIVPVVLAVRYHGALTLLKPASTAEVFAAREATVAAVEDSRAKASRHEYHQERTLGRIEREVRRLSVLIPQSGERGQESLLDVLFVTSNGAGLGHITRLLAVSDHLPHSRRFELLTLSKAYRRVAGDGVTVHYFPSSEATGENTERWNRAFRDYFRGLVVSRRPSVVVFDGTWVYNGLTDVCRALGIRLVWMQRGMWRQEVDEKSVQRHSAAGVVDHVVVPGDYAGTEIVDAGDGIEPVYVGPIVRTGRDDLRDRRSACIALGLDPGERYVLLNLGGGSISDPDSIAHAALAEVREASPELTPVQVVSPLAGSMEEVPGLMRITAYPVMVNVAAFEYMIAAAGYNSAQEAVSLGIPSVLVPNSATKTDDQVRRAGRLAEQGLCSVAEDAKGLREAVFRMADPDARKLLREQLGRLDEPRGAQEAARVIDEIVDDAGWLRHVETVNGSEARDD